jgi:agmatinase
MIELDASPGCNTLFGWPGQRAGTIAARTLCVVGVPTELGNPLARGTRLAPAAIRRASLDHAAPPVAGIDWGDLTLPGVLDQQSLLENLAVTAARIYDSNLCPLLLGGDHSITYAPVSVL